MGTSMMGTVTFFFPVPSIVIMMSSIDITLVFLLLCLFPVSLFQSFVVFTFFCLLLFERINMYIFHYPVVC